MQEEPRWNIQEDAEADRYKNIDRVNGAEGGGGQTE